MSKRWAKWLALVAVPAASVCGPMLAPAGQDSEERVFRGHEGWVGSAAFSPDGKVLASAGGDHTARLWNLTTGEALAVLKGHSNCVTAAAFAPDGQSLATASYDKTVRIWDLARLAEGSVSARAELRGHAGPVLALAFSPSGKLLATAGADATVKLWDPTSPRSPRSPRAASAPEKPLATLEGHKSWVNTLGFSSDGRFLVTGSSDGTVKLWRFAPETARPQLQSTIPSTKDGEIRSVAVSPDGKYVAAGTRYGAVRVWQVVSSAEATRLTAPITLRGHTADVWSVAFAPDGRTLASGDGDWNRPGQIKLWDTADWKPKTVLAHTGEVLSLAFSPDSRSLGAGSWDKTIKLWNLPGK